MNRLVALGISLSLVACTPTKRPTRKPVPKPTIENHGNLSLSDGAPAVSGGAAGAPLYVTHGGAWAAGEAPARPVVAVVAKDTAGATWVLHRRHSANIDGAAVLGTAPEGAYLRPAVSAGTVENGAFVGHFPVGTTDQDRFVLVASGPGAPSTRVVGVLAKRGGERAAVVDAAAEGKSVLAVRVASLAPEIRAQPLAAALDASCSEEVAAAVRAEATRVGLGPVTWGDRGIKVVCGEKSFRLEGTRRLLRTPFWAPRTVRVTSPAGVVAVLAAARGELDLALYALPADDVDYVRAALATQAGWCADAPAVLNATPSARSGLILAGAAYELGDNAAALAPLQDGRWENVTGEEAWRRELARAAIKLDMGDTKGAAAGLQAAAEQAPDPVSRRSLLLGLAEVHLATGDFESFVKALVASRGDSGAASGEPTRAQEALTSRYTALTLSAQGRLDDAIALYASAAATSEADGDLRQAAQALLRIAELKVVSQRDASAELTQARDYAIQYHDDELLGQVALDDLTRFAEKNAAVDAPEGGAAKLEVAVAANLRADRLDRVALARRYGLLLLPSKADLSSKKKAVKDALDAAFAAPDLQEITLLLSLLAQLDGAGFSFDAANRNIDLAIAFANAMGDKGLAEVLTEEKRAFQ